MQVKRHGEWGPLYADLAESPKHLALSAAAEGLWTRCLAWTFKWSEDGFVPRYVVEQRVRPSEHVETLIAELCSVALGEMTALWDAVDGGFHFHDWQGQPRSVRERLRGEARSRMASLREPSVKVQRTSRERSADVHDIQVEVDSVLGNREPVVLSLPSVPDRAVAVWNDRKASKQPTVRVVPPKMARDIQGFLRQLHGDLEAFGRAVDAFAADDFMAGRDGQSNRAYGLDTMVRPANCARWVNAALDVPVETTPAQYTDVEHIRTMGGPDIIDALIGTLQ